MAARKKAPAKGRKSKKIATPKATASKARGGKIAGSIKKVMAARTSFPSNPITQKQSKAQIFAELSTITGLGKGDIRQFFAGLRNIAERSLKGKGFGEFIVPELGVKVRRIHKGATKARMGRNPFTGEEIQIAAKPARKSVKATALKALKELVA